MGMQDVSLLLEKFISVIYYINRLKEKSVYPNAEKALYKVLSYLE